MSSNLPREDPLRKSSIPPRPSRLPRIIREVELVEGAGVAQHGDGSHQEEYQHTEEKGQPDGYASLGPDGELVEVPDASVVPYTPSVGEHWTDVPTAVAPAVDELVARMQGVEGGAGHSTHDAPDVDYTPGDGADWADPDPATVQEALDALAAAGGGGGDVATDAIWDAAGDVAVGTGADTAARLAMGSALQVLRVNAGATALEWAAAGGGPDTVDLWLEGMFGA